MNRKLTEESVLKIRRLYGVVPGYVIAKKYGVTGATISFIQKRRRWGWLQTTLQEKSNAGKSK